MFSRIVSPGISSPVVIGSSVVAMALRTLALATVPRDDAPWTARSARRGRDARCRGARRLRLSSSSSSSSASSSANSSTSTATQPASSSASTAASLPTQTAQNGFEGVPIEPGQDLGPRSTDSAPVDGIQCGSREQLFYHIHTHLLVFVNGVPRSLPGGIGIPGSTIEQSTEGPVAAGGKCIYWLHTHAPDGIIHVESPARRMYTLGNFFDEWRQPLSSTQVATAKGPVSVVVDGKAWTKSPRAIPLLPHLVIQISVGQPVTPVSVSGALLDRADQG